MFGTLGFSYVGLIYLLMLFIPNIIWSRSKPLDYDSTRENKGLLLFERVGQVCTTCVVLIFSNFNIGSSPAWDLWLIVSFLLMIVYEICWARYFISERRATDFYQSFCGIPVPLASLPIMAFLLLGIYGKVIWLIISVIILGIGHIGIHLQHLQDTKLE